MPNGDNEERDSGRSARRRDIAKRHGERGPYPSAAENSRLVAGALGPQLKSSYARLLAEPVPRRFLELLEKLEARASQVSAVDKGGD